MKEATTKRISIAVLLLSAMVIVVLVMQGHINLRPNAGRGVVDGDINAFFRGSEIRLIVPNNPGGGYDDYARLLSGFLETYTGAKVRIVNLPGSGGMRALGELFNSPADGLTLGLLNGSGLAFNRVAKTSQMDFDIGSLSLLGRVSRDERVLVVSAGSRFTSFEDILQADDPFRFGATGFGGSTYADAVLSREFFGLNADVIHGFNNSSAVRLAMLTGKIDGAWSSWGSVADAVASGQFLPVLQLGVTGNEGLSTVPTVHEYKAHAPVIEGLVERMTVWAELHNIGRPIAAPPGVSSATLAYLREAIRLAMSDQALIQLAIDTRRPLAYASASEIEGYFSRLLQLPQDVEDYFVKSMRNEL